MQAIRDDLYIEASADFSRQYTWYLQRNPDVLKDLTGWTAKAAIRQSRQSVDPAILALVTPVGIVLGGALGTITTFITAAQATALVGTFMGAGVWDMELVDPAGKTMRFAEGLVYVKQAVSR